MLVIFALSSILFVGLSAVVVDVAWYWANTLRVQRAADAAALAGAVLLPGKVNTGLDNAYLRATNEAAKNGYTAGGGVTVTPIQNSVAVAGGNPNELDVTITAPVNTFFMRVFGITSINATRSSKAEFVLPVPMGSPQNYYGVGQFLGTHVDLGSADTGWDHSATTVSNGQWQNPGNADNNQDGKYAQGPSNLTSGGSAAQWWNQFGLLSGAGAIPNDGSLVIDGLEVRLWDRLLPNPSSVANCQLSLGLSWNGGVSWTTEQGPVNLIKTAPRLDSFGSATSLAAWGSHTWVRNDFTDTNFQARLTWTRGTGCGPAAYAGVDTLEVRVTYHTDASITYVENASPTDVTDPVTGTVLAPQNFWGAIFTKGGVRQNGDYFAPATIGSTASGVFPAPATSTTDPSPTYTANGYDYSIDFTGSSDGQVRLYDPMFCATAPNTTSGWYGAGDHWTTQGSSGGTVVAPVAVTYSLYLDGNNTPYDPTDDTLIGTPLSYDPAGKTMGDFSGTVGNPHGVQNYGRDDAQDCSAMPGHDQWVSPAGWTGLAGGMYRLNVQTSSQAANATVGAENLFSIWVKASGGEARVYGGGRMAGYTQIGAAAQSFYLAQIAQKHAGKTLQIQLFDPGDVGGNAYLYIQSPDGNQYHNATFDYQADSACANGRSDSCSGTGRTFIQTAKSGSGSSFDNSMITITIALPDDYGTKDLYGKGAGLTPPGVPGANADDQAGWWKIYYDVTNANDTTTWMVNILGNPVHLKVP